MPIPSPTTQSFFQHLARMSRVSADCPQMNFILGMASAGFQAVIQEIKKDLKYMRKPSITDGERFKRCEQKFLENHNAHLYVDLVELGKIKEMLPSSEYSNSLEFIEETKRKHQEWIKALEDFYMIFMAIINA